MENEKYYIAVNAGDRYPLLKTPQDYTEYFNEALSFGDLFDSLPSILVSYRALSLLANSFCSISAFSFFEGNKKGR